MQQAHLPLQGQLVDDHCELQFHGGSIPIKPGSLDGHCTVCPENLSAFPEHNMGLCQRLPVSPALTTPGHLCWASW